MSPRLEYRIYEIIPGLIIWITIIGSFLLSIFAPLWAVIIIIIFDLYWLLRVIYFCINLFISWRHMKQVLRVDWLSRMQTIVGWDKRVHVVMLPTYKESKEVVFHTLRTLEQSSYPTQKMVVVLAGEQKDEENFRRIAKEAQHQYRDTFREILVTLHPSGIEGELPGKGSNLHFAGPIVKNWADAHGISYADVIISAFDVDTLPHRDYFSYLTYVYCTHPNPTRSSYQPIPLYFNNVWETRGIARVMSFGTTFWMMSEITRPFRLWTFSSHSMSLQALVDAGFWQNNLVSEDSRIFLQMFIRYDGNYEVTPLYLPVSMDTVEGESWWESVKNVYVQQRRWAWGVENFPFMCWHFRRNSRIPFAKKRAMILRYAEGMYSWAVASILILVLGRLPLYLAADSLQSSVLFQNTPFVLEQLMRYAMGGLFVSAGLSFTLLPQRPAHVPISTYFYLLLNWILLPVTLLGLGSLPAIDAQTRLMMGSYLGFNVTQKKR